VAVIVVVQVAEVVESYVVIRWVYAARSLGRLSSKGCAWIVDDYRGHHARLESFEELKRTPP
jgi:hypothetical protein